MKLLFFINTLNGGGAEKVLVDLVNQLPHDKYEITITTLLRGLHDNDLSPHINHRSIIETNNRLITYALLRFYCKLIPHRFFARLFLYGRFDAVISYLEGFPTRILASYRGKGKRIAFVHCNAEADRSWLQAYSSLDDCLRQYRTFDRVCFISQDSLDGFERLIGSLPNACVTHNVIDFKTAIDKSRELDPIFKQFATKSSVRFITVGRLTKVKGFERLLNAFARLRDDNLDCELIICGEGDQRQELESIKANRGISNVHFLGYQSNPYQLMARADVYVCSSYSEGYSTSVAESIALGVPVLTTNCSGMSELLSNGEYGDIVENSEEGIYQGLKYLLINGGHLHELKTKVAVRSQELLSMNPLKEYLDLFDSL